MSATRFVTVLNFLSIIASIAVNTVQAQRMPFKYLTVEDGLSQNTVSSIAQDSLGFMWFGTKNGLCRYDGYVFRIFESNTLDSLTLSSNTINSLQVESRTKLWIGTTQGLCLWDQQRGRIFRMNAVFENDSLKGSYNIGDLFIDSKGDFWLMAEAGGFHIFQKKNGETKFKKCLTLKDPPGNNDGFYGQFMEDNVGNIWIGTSRRGVWQYNRTDNKFSQLLPLGNKGIFAVTSLVHDKRGITWIGTLSGLYSWSPGRKDPEVVQGINDPLIRALYLDNRGRVVIGTDRGGLNVYSAETNSFTIYNEESGTSHGLLHNSVQCIFQDSHNILWVGTYAGGVNYHNPYLDVFTNYHSGDGNKYLSSNIISGFAEDKRGNVWIATDRGGLNYLNRKTNSFQYFRSIKNNNQTLSTDIIQHVAMSREGDLLIGTWLNGLDIYNSKKNLFTHYKRDARDSTSIADNSINYILEDKRGTVWLGTNSGLSVSKNPLDNGTLVFKNFKNNPAKANSISDSYVKTIFQDRQGNVWIATWVGLNRWDPSTGTFFNHNNNPDNLAVFTRHYILCIGEDENDVLLMGTNENGLLLYDRNKNELKNFTKSDGLPSNTVVGLEKHDKGNWWISTTNGLTRFDQRTHTFAVYNRHDGLPSNEFRFNAHTKLRNGELLFGGNNGFAFFHPDSIKENRYAPRVSFTGFRLHNERIESSSTGVLRNDISVTSEVILPPDYSSIGIDFIGINFTASQKNSYAYMLEGIDNDWNFSADQHYANYSYLPAGEYRFQVKASNSDGVWSSPISLSITINPFWWNTTWFRFFSLGFGITAVWILFKVRTRQLRARKRILEKTVKERTSELENKNALLSDAKEELQVQTEEIKKQRDSIEEQLRTIQTLNEIGHKITAYLKKAELVMSIHSMINRFMDAPHLSIGHISVDKNEIEFSSIRSSGSPITDELVSLGETGRLSVASISRNKVISIGDVQSDINTILPNYSLKYENETGEKSAVYIPLVSMNGVVDGILIVKSFQKNAFSAIQVDILKTLAAYIGIAYENARVYKEIEAQSEVLTEQAEKLKELNEIKSRFFINMSHEFRTPLTLIISPLEQLLEDNNEPKWSYLRQQLVIMNKNASHLLKLINQLLELKNVELKTDKPFFSAHDIVVFLKNVMMQFEHLAGRYAIQFKIVASESSLFLHFDREMMEKVFINLYSNAFKYTPRGGSITTLLRIKKEKEPAYVEIQICDSGKGIAKKDLPFIFERFYQGDDPIHQIQEGTGLGLSLVKDFIELHSGHVEVFSEQARGTTFTIALPYPYESLTQEGPDSPEKDSDADDESEGKLLPLVLLIDDNKDVLDFLRLSLENDFRLLFAENGKAANELAIYHVPDVIISDVMMPVMDGVQLCGNIKADPRTSHIPVILLTAKTGENSQVVGLDAGADDYIAKPFKVKVLKARINNIIATRKKLHELFSSHRNFDIGDFIANDHDKDFLERLDEILKTNIKNSSLNQEALTREIGMSKTQLYRKLKALTGKTVHEYIRNYRLGVAHEIIKQSDLLIYEVAYEVGFSDAAYFSNSFHAYFGIWPKDLKKV